MPRVLRTRVPRRAVTTLELLLVIPILVIVLVFCVQFGIVALYQAAVTHAASVAAREAGKGEDLDAVIDVVQPIVGIHGIEIRDDPGSGVKVILEGPSGEPAREYGDPELICPLPANPVEGYQVRVTVCVDLAATRFCDALAVWGLTFAGRMLRASSLVMLEFEQDVE